MGSEVDWISYGRGSQGDTVAEGTWGIEEWPGREENQPKPISYENALRKTVFCRLNFKKLL